MTTIVHLLRHGEVHNPRASSTGAPPASTSPSAAARWPTGSPTRVGDRDITHIVSSPLERAQETAAPLAAARGLTVRARRAGDRVRQHLRGQAVRRRATRSCASRRSGAACGTRSGRRGASPTSEVVARMWPAVLDAREEAAGHEAVDRLPPAADLDHPAQGRGTAVPARPAQAALHPVQPDLVHLRGRAPGQRRLLRARRRPDPARRPWRALLRRWRRRRAPAAFRAALRTLGLRCAASVRLLLAVLLVGAVRSGCGGSAGTGDKGYVDGKGIDHPARGGRPQEAR